MWQQGQVSLPLHVRLKYSRSISEIQLTSYKHHTLRQCFYIQLQGWILYYARCNHDHTVAFLLLTISSASAPYSSVLVFNHILFQDTSEERCWKECHQRSYNTISNDNPKPTTNPSSALKKFQSITILEFEWVSSNVGCSDHGSVDARSISKGYPHNPLFHS